MSAITKCLADERILWIVDCASRQSKCESPERKEATTLNNEEVDGSDEDDETDGR
ncbi:hypothetical protein K0M31_020419 [Melipona bicolor]|uniref:Uncharacterized protein n=1 Tax=Melipona bicolor TaxID=60889 RepID=A0AA40G1F0_9HYME|nr:hypothetical protein K0M31_020419 [Melipona bicolor]